MSNQSIREFFHEDHRRLDDLFRRYRQAKGTEHPLARELFHEFAAGLQRHIVWEEEVLFPLWERRTGMSDGGPTEVMRGEHRQIRAILEAMDHKVQQGNFQTDSEEADLLNVLSLHNIKEERVLYPAIDQVASEEDRATVFRAIETGPHEGESAPCQAADVPAAEG